jgi:phosphohistidine phosphatase
VEKLMPRRELLLVRHAKSSWKQPALIDRQRPLTPRGRQDARRMAKLLHKKGVRPELIVSSPARRAVQTARIFAKRLHYRRAQITIEEQLYEATPRQLIALIQRLDEGRRCVLLFGHNPELTQLARRWSRRMTHLRTCAVARFEFQARSWKRVGSTRPAKAKLEQPRSGPASADRVRHRS